MKSIKEASDLEGKKVLVRVDWNVPIENGEVLDDFRIEKSLPTVKYLLESGAQVFLATHLEEGEMQDLQSFVPKGAELLENLRVNSGEEANSTEFARELAGWADIYVNEAFSTSHREHASIVGVPKLLPRFAGLQLMQEVENLSKAFNPPHPFLFILGGAKQDTKIPLIEKFLDLSDSIFVGGTLAKPVSESSIGKNPNIFFPHGDITALDIDSETVRELSGKIKSAKFILWNGPLGNYEKGYRKGTLELAQAVAAASGESVVGGGDTLAAIKELGILEQFSFVSTGGGAMLDFLANGTLPGIKALSR